MSLFSGFGGLFDDDPFFGGHMRQLTQLNRMMDPFEMFGGFGGAVQPRGNALMPFGFPSIMDTFKMGAGDPNCHSFSSSTVMMTMSNGPDGRPQVYQESRSTRCAPGGVKETKKAVSDSRTGTKRLAVGHHIGERGHVRERVQNLHSGEQEESEDFINIDEDEADTFNREWEGKAQDLTTGHSAIGYHRGVERGDTRRHRHLPAITSGNRYRPSSSYSSARRNNPALTYRSSEEPEIIAERPRKRARVPEATQSAPGKKSSKSRSSQE